MRRASCLALACITLFLAVAAAPATARGAEPLRRDVLAIYDTTREEEPRATRVHRFIELALNHLGYRVVYRTADGGKPDASEVERLAATVTWFDGPLPASASPTWIADLAYRDGGRPRAIAFGHPGVPLDLSESEGRNRYLARLGLRLQGLPVRVGSLATVVSVDAALVGRDAAFTPHSGTYENLAAVAGASVHLRIAPGADVGVGIDLVVTGTDAGYVAGEAALAWDPRLPSPLWLLDLHAFLEAVLQPLVFPIPDVSTAMGRRLFFATVTPEGWMSHLPASRYGEPTELAADLVVHLLARQFPGVPTSVAVVTGDIDPGVAGRHAEAARAAAEAIFVLPHVETATAGRSYVRDWSFFEHYAVADEEGRIAELGARTPEPGGGLLTTALRSLGDAFAERTQPERHAFARSPRKYAAEPFDLQTETRGALTTVATLAGAPSREPLFLWSGDAHPFPAALEAVDVPAIGGGGGVVDPFASPFGALWPVYGTVGDRIQVYSALSGEQAYVGAFLDAPWRFHSLPQALAATDAPMRLKPFHVSFAAGSLVEFGGRRAVETLFSKALVGDLLPVWPSTYTRMVEGFATADIRVLGPLRWEISDRGTLPTVRFERADALALDLATSEGVLGAARRGNTLYVSLDPTHPNAVVALAPSASATGIAGVNAAPAGNVAIESSRWLVSGIVRGECDVRFKASGFGAGDMTLVGPPGRPVRVDMALASEPDTAVYWATVDADSDGRIAINLPPTPDAVVVTVSSLCGPEP